MGYLGIHPYCGGTPSNSRSRERPHLPPLTGTDLASTIYVDNAANWPIAVITKKSSLPRGLAFVSHSSWCSGHCCRSGGEVRSARLPLPSMTSSFESCRRTSTSLNSNYLCRTLELFSPAGQLLLFHCYRTYQL